MCIFVEVSVLENAFGTFTRTHHHGYVFVEIQMQVRDEDLLETISATLLAIWRFHKFTESRWLTVGSATRVLVRAVLLGLDGFYSFLQKDLLVSRGVGFRCVLCIVLMCLCLVECFGDWCVCEQAQS